MMQLLILYALVGYCPEWWPKGPPFPPSPPPWWKLSFVKITSILAGIAVGLLVTKVIGFDDPVIGCFGAFAGGRISTDIARPLIGLDKKGTMAGA